MKYQSLNCKAQTIATRYKTCEKELLQIIIEVDKKKAYLHWGHNSLFSFVSKGLGLSPVVTSNFVTVARKSHEIPALKAKEPRAPRVWKTLLTPFWRHT